MTGGKFFPHSFELRHHTFSAVFSFPSKKLFRTRFSIRCTSERVYVQRPDSLSRRLHNACVWANELYLCCSFRVRLRQLYMHTYSTFSEAWRKYFQRACEQKTTHLRGRKHSVLHAESAGSFKSSIMLFMGKRLKPQGYMLAGLVCDEGKHAEAPWNLTNACLCELLLLLLAFWFKSFTAWWRMEAVWNDCDLYPVDGDKCWRAFTHSLTFLSLFQ